MAAIRINTPLSREAARELRAGDSVLLSGTIYTARDAAHKRLCEIIEKEGADALPFDLKDAVIYFVGPTPERPGEIIGSAGPTTSYRMDAYSPILIEHGQTAMIGKGMRGDNVVLAMKKHGAVYFGAIGGCGALLASCVKEKTTVCYEDLGAEAVCKLRVEDFPLTVVIDSYGNNLYEIGKESYLNSIK